MLRLRTWGPCVVTAVLACASAGAQEKKAPPVFGSDVQLITVDAVVVDKAGHPVPGLTKDDFVVIEDGKRQEVVSFEAFTVQAAGSGAAEPSAAPAVGAASPKKAGRSFALVLDDLSMTPIEARFATQGLGGFVERSMGPDDTLLVATTSGAIWQPGRFPEGREQIQKALDGVRGLFVDGQALSDYMSDAEAYSITSHPQSWAMGAILDRWSRSGPCGDASPACQSMIAAQAQAIDSIRHDRTRATLAALQRVMQSLAADHGRKSVLFVSTGFVADGDPVQRETAALSREANAAVYFLDARGLHALEAAGVPSASFSGAPPSPGVIPFLTLQASAFATGGAQDLAIDTGGFSVRNTNDLGLGASRIADQSRVYYLLGFHPPAGKKTGTWRKIKVQVAPKGLEVHARRGYKASPASPLPADKKVSGTETVASLE